MSRDLPPPAFGDLHPPAEGSLARSRAMGAAWARYIEAEATARHLMGNYLANHRLSGPISPSLADVAAACRRADAALVNHARASLAQSGSVPA